MSLSSIMPIATLTPAARIRPTLRLGRGQLLEARGQVVERRGDHRHARRGDLVGDRQPSVAPTSTILRRGKFAPEREHVARCRLARSTWTSSNCRPCTTGTSAAASNRVSSTSSLRRASRSSRLSGSRRDVVDRRRRCGRRAPPMPAAVARRVARLAQRVAEQGMGRRRAMPPALPAPSSPSSTNWKARARVIGVHVGAEVDDRALPGEDAARRRRARRPRG